MGDRNLFRHQPALDTESDGARRRCDEAQKWLLPAHAVREQKLVPTQLLDDRAGLRFEEEPAVWKPASDLGVGNGSDEGTRALALEAHWLGFRTVVAV